MPLKLQEHFGGVLVRVLSAHIDMPQPATRLYIPLFKAKRFLLGLILYIYKKQLQVSRRLVAEQVDKKKANDASPQKISAVCPKTAPIKCLLPVL